MWGWAGALCLSSSPHDMPGFRQANSSEDKHKAPSSTPPRPLSLQHVGPQTALSLPVLVVNLHYRPKWTPTSNPAPCHPERVSRSPERSEGEGSSPHLTPSHHHEIFPYHD